MGICILLNYANLSVSKVFFPAVWVKEAENKSYIKILNNKRYLKHCVVCRGVSYFTKYTFTAVYMEPKHKHSNYKL